MPEFTAVKLTPPPAVTFCCVEAVVLSVAKVGAMERTAAVLPAAEAIVEVLVAPVLVAETISVPVILSGADPTVPIWA